MMYPRFGLLRMLFGLGWLLAGTITTAAAAPGAGEHVDLIGVRVSDVEGRQHRIGVSMGKVQPVALVFLDTACPVATRYIPVLNELYGSDRSRGVSLYGVLSNPDIGWREGADFVDRFNIEFPVLFDSAGDLAVRLEPRVMSESFVISTANRVVYRGRVDDRFVAVGRLRTRVTSHDLRDVVENVASRRAVRNRTKTEAVGCFHPRLGRGRRAGRRDRKRSPGRVTSLRCSRPTASSATAEAVSRPFSLEGYDNARSAGIGWSPG